MLYLLPGVISCTPLLFIEVEGMKNKGAIITTSIITLFFVVIYWRFMDIYPAS